MACGAARGDDHANGWGRARSRGSLIGGVTHDDTGVAAVGHTANRPRHPEGVRVTSGPRGGSR
jgi:hypothetical protein